MNIVEMRDIRVAYDRSPILPDINLDVKRGDFLAISGPNGGGKTTLLRVMLKLLRPDTGSVTYYNAEGKQDKRLAIGYLPQKNNIDTRFPITVEQVVRSGLIRGFFARRNPKDEARLQEIVELMGIGDYLNRSIGALSGGQLQRTLLGRALISKPELVVLDEPLSYVDSNFERQIYSIMEKVAREATVVLVSHQMSVISQMATRHVVVDRGLHDCSSAHHGVRSICDD